MKLHVPYKQYIDITLSKRDIREIIRISFIKLLDVPEKYQNEYRYYIPRIDIEGDLYMDYSDMETSMENFIRKATNKDKEICKVYGYFIDGDKEIT